MKVHLIRWIGTHAEYDLLCKYFKQYTISEY
jgi:mRNA-degrading endonuclease HigB of HigAB toxin-antitoxin module